MLLIQTCRHTHGLTPEQDASKDGVVAVHCAAVPAVVSELVLALSDPLLGALTDGLHDVWVALAELPLLVHQARDVVANHTGPQCPDVPDNAEDTQNLKTATTLTCVVYGYVMSRARSDCN